jgi:hypothetical protein
MQFPKCRSPFFLWTSGGLRFVETGKISPADFYMIIIWKANRAKTRKKAADTLSATRIFYGSAAVQYRVTSFSVLWPVMAAI